MENLEGSSRLTEEFLDNFINAFSQELEKMVTGPGNRFSDEDMEIVGKFREFRKLPREHGWFQDLLIRVGQDFRLTPDEIEILKDRFLE